MSDIVERLRALAPIKEALEAAAEIERLKAELRAALQRAADSAQISWTESYERHRAENERLRAALREAEDMIEQGQYGDALTRIDTALSGKGEK